MYRLLLLAFAAFAASSPALAFPLFNPAAPQPTQHQLESRYAENQSQPYAMNYTDEAAQRLGVHDGEWEAFNTHSSDPLVPSFQGGVDHGAAMLKLEWHPGP
jgi:hypothetical protein